VDFTERSRDMFSEFRKCGNVQGEVFIGDFNQNFTAPVALWFKVEQPKLDHGVCESAAR
jgi:hypothetical protein